MPNPNPSPETRFQPGESGNPGGKPKGTISIKNEIRKYLRENPGEVDRIVKYFVEKNPELAWQMLEGKPHQTQDITSGDEPLQPVLVKFLNADKPND